MQCIEQLEARLKWIAENSERFYHTQEGLWWLRPLKDDGSINYDGGRVPGVSLGPWLTLDALIRDQQ